MNALIVAKQGSDCEVQADLLLSAHEVQRLYIELHRLRIVTSRMPTFASRGSKRPSSEWAGLPVAEQQAEPCM